MPKPKNKDLKQLGKKEREDKIKELKLELIKKQGKKKEIKKTIAKLLSIK